MIPGSNHATPETEAPAAAGAEPATPASTPSPASAPAEAGAEGSDPIAALAAERDELKDRLLRTLAEMENLRRRTERDVAQARDYAVTQFARDVLGVADNLRRAIEAAGGGQGAGAGQTSSGQGSSGQGSSGQGFSGQGSAGPSSLEGGAGSGAAEEGRLRALLDGVELTERDLLKTLERHKVVLIDPKGEKFDPNFHQAMFEAPDPATPKGHVMQVLQVGFRLGDRPLRPALVGVSSGAPAAAANGTAPTSAA